MTSHYRAYRQPFDFPTMPRGRLVLAVQLIDVDGAFLIHIDDGDIAVRAKPDGALFWVDLPNPSRIFTGYLDILIQRQAAFVHFSQDQGDAGFNTAETRDAVPDCRFGELSVNIRTFFIESMR